MTNKILFVDDEPAVLDGYSRMLRKDFEINTAVGGENGLESIRSQGPYAVVISDMRMPPRDVAGKHPHGAYRLCRHQECDGCSQ